jgi:hypothetical protein
VNNAAFLLNVHFYDSRFAMFRRIVCQRRWPSCSTAETDMTVLQDHTGELASRSELISAAPLLLLAPHKPRAPTVILSPAKRAALTACLNGGVLHKRAGIWTAPSAAASDKPIFGVTVADLGRDGMLTLSTLYGSASARLTTRGNWFARTVVTEMAEGGSVI